MKRLLIALAAAVAMLTASAKVTDTQSFETSFSDFEPSVAAEDESALVDYDNDGPDFDAPYNFADFGSKYLSLDTGDATLWRTNTAVGNVYFDMALQFNPSASAPELDTENDPTKILLYQNTESNLVILAGPVSDNKPTSYVTTTKVTPGTWARVTVSSSLENDGYVFTVRVNGTPLATAEEVASFPSLTDATEISQIGFAGSGALDDFVARTTDPFLENPAAMIGGEGYASFADALADDPTATVQLQADASMPAPLAYGESISVKLNNHTLSGITTGSLVPVASTSGDVTTYTASYFPRTATAGQDGTTANPYEIADADDLVALQEAILVDAATFSSKSYVQTANIDMTGVEGFYGIGWFASSTSFASVPSGVASNGKTDIPFAGTYDGQGYTNSNVTIVKHSYAGVFNNVSGTVKNLTVQDIDCSGTCSEWGCAIVGNAVGATLQNLTASGSTWGDTPNHNAAGIVVRAQGNTTISGCVNNVALSTTGKRLGGILAFAATSGTVSIQNCTNNAALSSTDGTRGVGGILSSPEAGAGATAVVISGCADFGSETAGASGYTGAIVGSLWSSTHTYTDGGGNTYPASSDVCGSFNEKTVYGLAYALPVTIAEADYLTTVKQADLAAGSTYTLIADVAASETPVYTFESAGTISFNTEKGFTFEGTVAVDTTTLVPAEPVTEGTVTTYGATAGVAAVDNFAYATFDEAVAALEGETEDDFVTLLADVATTLSAGTTLKVKQNGHNLTPSKGADDVIIGYNTVDGVTTYIATEGVASVYHMGTTTWYATFAAAYDAANAITTGDYPTLTVKVGSDFTPAITYSQFFQKIKFESTTEDPITVNLKNAAGTYTMTAVGYQASANVTLVLPTDFTAVNEAYLTGGCTVEVPEGVTLTLASGSSGTLVNIGGLVGAGTLVAPTDAGALANFIASEKYSGWLKAGSWTGTLQCSGNSPEVSFANIANANASIRFCGFTNYIHNAVSTSGFKAVDLVGDGLALVGNYQYGTNTFSAPLTGSGRLYVNVTDSVNGTALKQAVFSGDVSGFAGSIEIAAGANCSVNFGSSPVCSGTRQIGVASGKAVTVAEGATWAASDFIFPGSVTLNGTLVDIDDSTVGKVWNNADGAVLTANVANAFKFGNTTSWVGTYNVNYDNAAAGNAFAMPQNAGATIVINGANGVFKGYPTTGSGAPTVAGPITLNADWTIGDGYPGTANKTTLAKLSGDGSLTTCTKTVSNTVYYEFTELDNYTNGVITISDGTSVTIGRVNVDTTPANNSRVVKITKVEAGVCNDNVPLYVGGVDTGKTLTYDANGAEGEGLYYIVSGGTPVIDPATGKVSADTAEAAAAAGVAVSSDVAAALTTAGVSEETYQGYFTKSAPVYNEATGKYEVTATISETVVSGVEESAIAALTTGATTVTVPAGLYYRITPSADLSTWGEVATDLSKGTAITVTKPSSTGKGFFKVELSAAPFTE